MSPKVWVIYRVSANGTFDIVRAFTDLSSAEMAIEFSNMGWKEGEEKFYFKEVFLHGDK